MLVIRDIFTAKPGKASTLAQLFKKVFSRINNAKVMTDAIGDFNTVIIEFEVESLAVYEEMFNRVRSGEMFEGLDEETITAMKSYTDLYITGKRDVLRVVE